MVNNPLYDEVWFCYPSTGFSQPNRALIYNWKYDKFTEADIDFQCSGLGQVTLSTTGAWADAQITWLQDPGPWATSQRRRTVIGNPLTQKIHLLDHGVLRDGKRFVGTLQRTGLSIIGRKRTGEWIEDFQRRKQVNRIWPKVFLGPVNVRIGYQDLVNGPVRWNGYQPFDPTQQVFVDGVLGSGRSIAIEYSAANDFRIDGYKIDLVPLGMY
jgi:hypothetical protein